MSEIDMEEVRRKVFRASTEHGVFDLLLGLFLLFYAYQLGWAFDYGMGEAGRSGLIGPVFVALVFVIFPAAVKRRLAARAGYFKATFEPGWTMVVLVILPLILLPFYVAAGLKLAPEALRVVTVLPWLPALFGVVLARLFLTLLRAGGRAHLPGVHCARPACRPGLHRTRSFVARGPADGPLCHTRCCRAAPWSGQAGSLCEEVSGRRGEP